MHRLPWIAPCRAQLVSHDLGAVACNPSHSDRKNTRTSDLLMKFSEALLPEHAVSRNEMLTASIDHGPNARRACNSVSRFAEW